MIGMQTRPDQTNERSHDAGTDAATHERLAQQHRPTDPAALAGEIQRLAASGLKARDIATALRLPLDTVVNVLEALP
jgi:hypothetical protein